MKDPEISVAICTRNRGASLALTVASLSQTPAWLRWELLVIDNASEDDTQTRLRSIEADYPAPVRILSEPQIGLAKARNRALREARGEIVLFLDDDVTCEKGVVESHFNAFKDPAVVATGGRIVPNLPDDTPRWFRDEVFSNSGGPTARYDFGDEPGEVGIGVRPLPIGAHFGIRREIARGRGGFDESLGWGLSSIPGEETRLMDQIRAYGGRILYVPDAIVHHRIPPERTTFAYFDQWFERLGRFEALRSGRPMGLLRWKSIAQAAFRMGKWRLRLVVEGDPRRRIKYYRRLARARGRWLELMIPSQH